MSAKYERGGSLNSSVLLLNQGQKETLPIRKILKNIGVQQIIRIPTADYPENGYVPGSRLVHFGLPIENSRRDGLAALPKIVIFGHYNSDEDEQLPLLDFNNIWVAKVTRLIKAIPYDNLPQDCFNDPIGNVYDQDSLQALILSRYRHSLPILTDEEILAQGVSIRYLELKQRFSAPQNWF